MPLKCRCAAGLSALTFLIFALLPTLALAADQDRTKEGHVPRTRTAQKEATPASAAADLDEGGDRENPRQREQWFMRGRQYKGRPAAAMLMRAQQQRAQLREQAYRARQLKAAARALTLQQSGTSTTGWTELGPSPLMSVTVTGAQGDYGLVTGRTTAVAVDQGDPTGNTVYIGGAYGGVWKSTTAADPNPANVIWKPITDDQQTLAIGAIAIDPADSNIVLVGTGEANSSSDSYYGLGILRSTDAGNSWTLVSSANSGLRPFHGLAFAKIAFNSNNPSIVVAATAASSEGITVGAENPANDPTACKNAAATATCRGLYFSRDSGQTWSQATMVDPSGTPDNGSSTDVIYNAQQQKFYAWSRAHGLYTSSDGITFTHAADQGTGSNGVVQPTSTISAANCPTSPTNLGTCPIYRGQISLVPGRDEMYVWFVDSKTTPTNGGIYQTKDGGNTWATLNIATIVNCGDGSGCDTEQGDYNLVLTAVPNGPSGTDLYAGAINIYRCQITSNNPTCATSPFINLTHVYGCSPSGSFSKVHPDQHSFDFSVLNPNIIYFGNDGGIYRTIASQNGAVVPSSCQGSAPNQPFYPFDNLNGTIGSMTQFVWFQQHPTNQFTLLGGTQDNGSPAIDSTNSGTNGLTWRSVLGGDGGYTDINPNNGNQWFAANTRVSIFRCSNGTSCTNSQFGINPIISSASVGADSAAFYMPYMLDPQNSSQIILGTCRVWRVSSSGGVASNALSQTFDGSTGCLSSSPSLVSALAAGGPQNANGSSVIYAGTADGRVLVSTNATNTTTSWTEVSAAGGFNDPSVCTNGAVAISCPISGIAIDPRDATGKTAYVTVMGFNTPHVWQTTNAGSTWTDITGSPGTGGLPDSPADGAVIDKSTGTIYVATDVGVFSTASAAGSATQWTEVGPATSPGTLPNVAVTRVAIFNPAGQPPRLRVSTYGRGIWEMPLPGSTLPDYGISISNADLVTFPAQTVTYNGSQTTFNGYNGTVTLACDAVSQGVAGPLPSICSTSAIAGGAFSVTASNAAVQDFAFRIQATDGTLVRQAPVTLRVIDFGLAAPSPSSISNLVHGFSASVQSGVTSLGSFDQAVVLDCDPATLPAGMTCSFSPLALNAGGTAPLTVTFNTTLATPAGTHSPSIRATSTIDSNHSLQRTQTVSVNVTATPDFSLGSPVFVNSNVAVGQPLSATITVTPQDGYAGSVSLSCSGSSSGIAPSACAFNPATLTIGATSQSASLSVDTTNGLAGNGQVTVKASDGTLTHTAAVPFVLTAAGTPDFNFNFTSTSVSAKAGAPITPIPLTLNATGGFTGSVSWGVAGCPQLAQCAVSPTSTIPGQVANLTITTTAPTVSSLRTGSGNYLALWIGLPFGALGLVFLRRPKGAALLTVAFVMLLGLAACGGGGGSGGTTPPVTHPGTPAGTYTIVVTGTAGTTTHSQNFTLTVTP